MILRKLFAKAASLAATISVLIAMIKPIMNLIQEMEDVIKGEKKGKDRKDGILDSIRTILEGLTDLFSFNLPVDFIMNIVDKLIEILFTLLQRTGNLEPDPEEELKKVVQRGEITKG